VKKLKRANEDYDAHRFIDHKSDRGFGEKLDSAAAPFVTYFASRKKTFYEGAQRGR
jgi:hypothetical protein